MASATARAPSARAVWLGYWRSGGSPRSEPVLDHSHIGSGACPTPPATRLCRYYAVQHRRLADYSSTTCRRICFSECRSRCAWQISLDPGRFLNRLSADLILNSPWMDAAIDRGKIKNGGGIERDREIGAFSSNCRYPFALRSQAGDLAARGQLVWLRR